MNFIFATVGRVCWIEKEAGGIGEGEVCFCEDGGKQMKVPTDND